MFEVNQRQAYPGVQFFYLWNKEIWAAIKGSKHLIGKAPLETAVLVPNPSTLRLYGLPKLHKDDNPL